MADSLSPSAWSGKPYRPVFPEPPEAARASRPSRHGSRGNDGLAQALGWFSVGLGMAQLFAPRAMARTAGLSGHPGWMRAVGAREIAVGVGILSTRRPAGWLWTRVAGDAMDLALLGMAAGTGGRRRRRAALAAGAVAGVAALDLLTSVRHSRQPRPAKALSVSNAVTVEKSITVNRSPEECYRFWRDLENLPRFMRHLEEVTVTGHQLTHWKARAPVGTSVEWDAEVTIDQPGELLAWHSVADADVDNAGTVHFLRGPGGRGTIVRVDLQYSPPGGKAGAWLAWLLGEEPSQQLDEDLRRFKWLIETGEIPTTVGQPAGRRDPLVRMLFRKGEPG